MNKSSRTISNKSERISNKSELNSDFDGVIEMQDLTGQAQLINNDPMDLDAMTTISDEYLYANGRIKKRISRGIKNTTGRIKNRIPKPKGLVRDIISNKGKVNLEKAKAQTIAARNMGKSDPALVAALTQQQAPAPVKSGPSTGMIVGLIFGGLAVIGIGYYFIKKGKKK